jgi:hypothetical protein
VALELIFEALETDFDALKTNFMARSGEKVAGEGDHGGRASTEWVTTRLTARSGLADCDPQRLVGGSPAVTHAAQPTAQKPGEGKKKKKKKKKNEEDDGS